MDPTNPRWDTSETRFARQKLFWSVVASVVASAALSTAIVVSCHDRGTHATAEPSHVETTAEPPATTAPPPGPTLIVIAPTTTEEPRAATNVTSARMTAVTPTAAPATTALPAAFVVPRVLTTAVAKPSPAAVVSGTRAAVPAAPALPIRDPVVPNGIATGTAPDPTMGAGRFATDAPPWAGSSFGMDAGAQTP